MLKEYSRDWRREGLKGNVTSVLRHFRPTILRTYCNIGPTAAACRMYILFC